MAGYLVLIWIQVGFYSVYVGMLGHGLVSLNSRRSWEKIILSLVHLAFRLFFINLYDFLFYTS